MSFTQQTYAFRSYIYRLCHDTTGDRQPGAKSLIATSVLKCKYKVSILRTTSLALVKDCKLVGLQCLLRHFHFQQYFSYIVAVSFIGRGNRSTRRKPPIQLSQVTDKLYHIKPGIHDTSFASKSPFKFLEFKFFDRVYHTRNLNQKT